MGTEGVPKGELCSRRPARSSQPPRQLCDLASSTRHRDLHPRILHRTDWGGFRAAGSRPHQAKIAGLRIGPMDRNPFCEAAPRVKYSAPVSVLFVPLDISSDDGTDRSQRGSSSFCSRSSRATSDRRRIGGIRRVGSAISTTTVQRGQALSRACHTHTCEPAETIGRFSDSQRVTPWNYTVALARSATVTNRLTSNSVPSRIIA